jgi:hypothetical protein
MLPLFPSGHFVEDTWTHKLASIELAGGLHEVLADGMVAHIRHIRFAIRNSSQLPEQDHMLTILVCWRISHELKASTNRMIALYINVICSTRPMQFRNKHIIIQRCSRRKHVILNSAN